MKKTMCSTSAASTIPVDGERGGIFNGLEDGRREWVSRNRNRAFDRLKANFPSSHDESQRASRAQQGFNGAAFVHGAVALCYLVEG